jgi:DNA-binding transcriptional LysR family regulator
MDSESLKSFIIIAETGSFSLAAERLHVTQPAVSKRIAQLEEQLDSKLFDRIGRSISLTESGQKLLPRAQRIIREIEDSKREIRDLSGNVSGNLSLGISHHIGLHRLPPVLKQFSQQHPEVRLDISFKDSEIALDDIAHGRLELAVVTLPPDSYAMPSNLHAEQIWPDPLVFVIASDHPLHKKGTIKLEQLAQLPAIMPGDTTYTGRLVKEAFTSRQLSLEVAMATNYLETIKMMVSIGLGWSVLPKTMLDSSLVTLQVSNTQLIRELGCIYHTGRSLSNAARAFIALLKQHRTRGLADSPQ